MWRIRSLKAMQDDSSTYVNANIMCPISHDVYISINWYALWILNSREKKFDVLKFHLTVSARIITESHNHEITFGKAHVEAALPSTSHWSLIISFLSNPDLINFIN